MEGINHLTSGMAVCRCVVVNLSPTAGIFVATKIHLQKVLRSSFAIGELSVWSWETHWPSMAAMIIHDIHVLFFFELKTYGVEINQTPLKPVLILREDSFIGNHVHAMLPN